LNTHLFKNRNPVSRLHRQKLVGHASCSFWLTGLSGSGKSTIANNVYHMLYHNKVHNYLLDGDNIRMGINNDLGFSLEDRQENIRRIAEIVKLFTDAGMVTLVSFICPMEKDRALATEIIGKEDIRWVYIDSPLTICEERDPKGLYQKARNGLISEFTGISSPYEVPAHPDLRIDSSGSDITTCAGQLYQFIMKQIACEDIDSTI
jgi:adenylylsulfate kinase